MFGVNMKFVCGGTELAEATSKISRIIKDNTPERILSGVKIVVANNKVSFIGTDNETTIERSVNAEIFVEGQTVVEGKFFCELVAKLRGVSVEIVVDKNNHMTIKYGDNMVSASCYNPNEYPKDRSWDRSQYFSIIGQDFYDLIEKISFCASSDEGRPILKGVYLESSDTTLIGVALDGYRLAKAIKPLEKSTGVLTAVVPAKALTEVIKIIEKTVDTIDVFIDKSWLLIDLVHTRISIRLLDGEYIKYSQVVPTSFTTTIHLPKTQIKDSIARVKLITASDKNNIITMELEQNLVKLSSQSEMGKIVEQVSGKLEGVELKIAFNAKFLTEVVGAIDAENFIIKLNNPTSPTIFLPVGSSDKDNKLQELLYLILPVRVA